jgi:hypothetical protein
MNNQKKIAIFVIAFCLVIFFKNNAFSVSATVKAENDYKYTLNLLRKMQTSIDNFSSEEKLSDYEKIRTQFNSAGEDYYGRNFSDAVIKFKALKLNIIPLLEKMAKEYLTRTKAILDSTEKECFEIMVDFDRNSSFGRYFHKPFDPLKDKKPYNDKYSAADYHLFKDSDQIEQYLKEGYSCYNYSKYLFEDPEIALLKKKDKKITSKNLEYIINRYVDVIKFCRQAKQYGIEIYKIRRVNQLGDIIRKYDLNQKQLIPIYDDRIPKDYKVDAIDNMNLLYSIEKQKLGE